MPNTGPNDGSREERTTRLPMFASPCTNPIEVTVLPSPETVGVVAVTSTSFPPRSKRLSSSRLRDSFALTGLRFSYSSSGKSSLAAIASIGSRFFFTQCPQVGLVSFIEDPGVSGEHKEFMTTTALYR